VAAYCGVVAYATALSTAIAGLLVALAGIGAVLLLAALVRGMPELISWALGPAGVVYVVAIAVHGRAVDEAAPLVATALLLCGELAAWSLDERWRIEEESVVVRRRALALGALTLVGLGASALVVAMAAAPPGRGLAWTTLGAVGAVGAVGIAAALVHRTAR
jgi:hypothetical protein